MRVSTITRSDERRLDQNIPGSLVASITRRWRNVFLHLQSADPAWVLQEHLAMGMPLTIQGGNSTWWHHQVLLSWLCNTSCTRFCSCFTTYPGLLFNVYSHTITCRAGTWCPWKSVSTICSWLQVVVTSFHSWKLFLLAKKVWSERAAQVTSVWVPIRVLTLASFSLSITVKHLLVLISCCEMFHTM